MTDLSFALGMPLSAIRAMPARDLNQYAIHTNRQDFPLRRIELVLANVGQMLALVLGKVTVPASSLLPDPTDTDEDADDSAATRHGTAAAASAGSPAMDDFFGCPYVPPTETPAATAPAPAHNNNTEPAHP